MALVSFDYTHVMYDDDDPLALVMALASLVPQAIILIYCTLIFSRREAETMIMFAGQVGTELVSKYLKSAIRQKRPDFYGGIQQHVTYGMPSSHAQFMAYYVVYLCLWMWFRVGFHFSLRKKILRSVSVFLLAALVCYSRLYLHYHTPIQVAVGIAVGAILGTGWFVAVVFLRELGIIDLLLDLWPARWFYIKDSAADRSSFVREEYYEWRRMRSKMKLLVKAD